MKIGINARFLSMPYTGIGQYTHNLLGALAEIDEGNEYFLFTHEVVELSLPDNFHQIRVPEKNMRSASFRKAHWEHVLLPNELRKWKVDLAHFLYPSNPNKALPIPGIVTVHDAIPWVLKPYRRRLRSRVYNGYAKMALKKASHIITVSDFSKQEIIKVAKIEEKNVSVIHLASPKLNEQVMPDDLPLRKNFLLYVGGYDDRKNVPLLLHAYQKFVANHYPIDLILVGAKNQDLEAYITDRYIEKVAGKYPVKPKGQIIMTEPLLNYELDSLYRNAIALVHPSVYEGFNLPLVEAMARQLPIVAADTPVNREVAGEAAFLVGTSGIDEFGLGIHQFLNDPAFRRSLKQNAAERIRKYDWKKCAEETLYVYNLFS
jgi:glycosyltransferase involved in cell wall biosynthesis